MAKHRPKKRKAQWIFHSMHTCEKLGSRGRMCSLNEGHRGKHFDSAHPGLGRWSVYAGAAKAERSRRAKAGWAMRKRGGSHRTRRSLKRRSR